MVVILTPIVLMVVGIPGYIFISMKQPVCNCFFFGGKGDDFLKS